MSYKIISKFIKDVSFEIPNPQAFIMLEKEISNYTLNFLLLMSIFKLYFEISFSNITKVRASGISKDISFMNFDIIL